MKKVVFKLLFLLFLLFRVSAIEGEIIYLEGYVWIDRGTSTIEADYGIAIYNGDTIKTDEASLIIISISDRADIKLRENTIFTLNSLEDNISLELKRGSVFSRVVRSVRGEYSVRTPTVVAGVRGTEFFLAYGRKIDEQPDVWLCVNSGSVEVAVPDTGNLVIVKEGKGVSIPGGKILTEPRQYDWTKKLNWNMDPDAGDVRDATKLDEAYTDLLDQDYD